MQSVAVKHIAVIIEPNMVVAVHSLLHKPPLSPATEYQRREVFFINTKIIKYSQKHLPVYLRRGARDKILLIIL